MKGGSIEDLTAIVQQLSLELNTLYKSLKESNNHQTKAIIRVKILETSKQLKILSDALIILKTHTKESMSSNPTIDSQSPVESKSIPSRVMRSLSFSRRTTRRKNGTGKTKVKKLRKKTNKKIHKKK